MSTRKEEQERLLFASQHGHGITLRIVQQSDHELLVDHASLYPAPQRLEEKGWIRAEWPTPENNRRARFYTLTTVGRKQVTAETWQWKRMATAIGRILGSEEA